MGMIRQLSFHSRLPHFLRLDILPFVFLYICLPYAYFMGYLTNFVAIVSAIAAVLSHGLTLLLGIWVIGFGTFFRYKKIRDPTRAQFVRVVPLPNKGPNQLCPLQRVTKPDGSVEVFFVYQKRKFAYNPETQTFVKPKFPIHNTYGTYLANTGYHNSEDVEAAQLLYGSNTFQIPIPTFWELYLILWRSYLQYKEHALAPFFVFQIFCVSLWMLDEYWYYSLFTLFMLLLFEGTVVMQRRSNLRLLRGMIQKPQNIQVYRAGKWTSIQSDQLVPGDICTVGRGGGGETVIPCDMLLLAGSAVVNEAMLTGESTPQMKESVKAANPDSVLSINRGGKLHVMFGGTRLVQHTHDASTPLKVPNNGCLTYVLRTGFETNQGKLMRTILFSSERVTANSLESFVFILFLLMFALVASWYVWREGMKDPERSPYKLLLECILIITSVVPPELPMELSLAVNTSLVALARFAIFCTEPFRIPLAGKVDVCCFDKTGTLTTDRIILKGVAGLEPGPFDLTPPADLPDTSHFVIAGCHALAHLENGGLVGDPLESAAMQGSGWTFTRSDCAVDKGRMKSVRVAHRHHFSSELKRMTTVIVLEHLNDKPMMVVMKGAPEVVEKYLGKVPTNYEETYKLFSRKGARVLAMAYKPFTTALASTELKALNRDVLETEMEFAGFLVFECPLKPDTQKAVTALAESSHHLIMITGDNALTACQVARDLGMVTKEAIILQPAETGLRWQTVAEKDVGPFEEHPTLLKQYHACVTGDALQTLVAAKMPRLGRFLSHVRVFARTSPDQKEAVVVALRDVGLTVLMCGDGTNDVGALKQAHVGVALLNHDEDPKKKEDPSKAVLPMPSAAHKSVLPGTEAVGKRRSNAPAQPSAKQGPKQPPPPRPKTFAALWKEINNNSPKDDDQVPVVRLGDASIASPFTAKSSSVMSVCHIIRQGRCTLVTTLQMFKILALNCLISAYSLSVLYLDGVKMGDMQATIIGMLIAASFLWISRAKPVDKLSPERPLPSIFSPYIFVSLMGQFALHMYCLIHVVDMAKSNSTERLKPDAPFAPNLLNTCVYLISSSMQVSTFAINYKGRPFKEDLRENPQLKWSLAIPALICVVCAAEIMPWFNEWIQLVPLPTPAFRWTIMAYILGDWVGAWLWEMLCARILGDTRRRREF